MPTTISIPANMMKLLEKEPRLILDIAAPGYWPIDLKHLRDSAFIKELFADQEFAKTHQIVIMKK